MQMVSAEEKAPLGKNARSLFKIQIDVQERIRKAAALGDLSENAEYHFAKEENRNIQRQLAELEAKLKTLRWSPTDNVPEDVVFLGHTVKLLDLDDDSEQLVRLVGEATPPDANSDILPVSVNSPMGGAMKAARRRNGKGQSARGGRWNLDSRNRAMSSARSLAQLVEHRFCKTAVVGSNPTAGCSRVLPHVF